MELFAQEVAGQAAQQPSMLTSMLPLVVIIAIFYLIVIMPARKKQKQHQEKIGSLSGGERILTAGGIFGTVVRVMDDRLEIKVDKNTHLQVAKSAVSTILKPDGEELSSEKKD
jgi:preprotein translocase subunit YajC